MSKRHIRDMFFEILIISFVIKGIFIISDIILKYIFEFNLIYIFIFLISLCVYISLGISTLKYLIKDFIYLLDKKEK